MPQMMPINWIFLFFYFLLIFILFNIMNYYNFNVNAKNKIKNKKIYFNKFNWKW